jgi:hypothetical protein
MVGARSERRRSSWGRQGAKRDTLGRVRGVLGCRRDCTDIWARVVARAAGEGEERVEWRPCLHASKCPKDVASASGGFRGQFEE